MVSEEVQIKNRFTGAVLFTVDLSAEFNDQSAAARLGTAIKLAIKAGAYLRSADLGHADLGGADLGHTDLGHADLSGADLSGADLSGADLSGADLSGADLRSADLGHTDLGGADLSGADLRSADLGHADLGGADLSGADLSGAYLRSADPVIAAGQPNGYWAFGYRDREGELRVKIGCQDKSIAEAREYWSTTHQSWDARKEIPATLDLIESIARLRGWADVGRGK